MEYIILGAILLVVLLPKTTGKEYTPKTYTEILLPIAKYIQVKYGIKPEITITQSALESKYGNSGLTQKANNLFGITGDTWRKLGKPVINMPSTEYVLGVPIPTNRWFRMYDSWNSSTEDWAKMISTLNIYGNAYYHAKKGNIKQFADEMQRVGYATYPKYSQAIQDRYEVIRQYV